MGTRDTLGLFNRKDSSKKLEKRSGQTQYVSSSRSVNVKCIYCGSSAIDTTRQLCKTHYNTLNKKLMKHGLPQLINYSRSAKNRGVCIVEGCESSGKINGLCRVHYRRLVKLRVIKM